MSFIDVPPPAVNNQPVIEHVIPAEKASTFHQNWARDYGRTAATTTRLIKTEQAATMKNKKYTTLIFDLGDVLIKWKPEETAAKIFPGTTAATIMYDIFRDPAWKMFDENKIDIPGLAKIAFEKYGHDRVFAEKVISTIPYHLPISQEIETAITQAKAQGYKLYVLSNMPQPYHVIFNERLSVFKLFDGITASHQTGFMKPEADIYKKLFADFNINPEEALFIDDREANIATGNMLKMDGIVCVDQADTLNLLYSEGILVKPTEKVTLEK